MWYVVVSFVEVSSVYGQRLNEQAYAINSPKKFIFLEYMLLYRKHLSLAAAPSQKKSKLYDNRPGETSSKFTSGTP